MQATFLRYGLILGIVGLLAAQGLRMAPTRPRADDATDGVSAGAMLRASVFWLMFAMMSMMSTSGLMVTSQLGAFALTAVLAIALLKPMRRRYLAGP